MDSYKTVLQEASDSFTEKKSRFIGWCGPVKAEEEAIAFVKKIKALHPEANHHVYAYSLRGGVMRYSDDGEPQGTAGVPVLDVIQKSGLTDVAVVVTRYFGGILLGGGGLVRAYSHSATVGIAAAKPAVMRKCLLMELRCDYGRYTKSEEAAVLNGGIVDDTVFDDGVTLKFHIVPEKLAALASEIADITSGKGVLKQTGEAYFSLEIQE